MSRRGFCLAFVMWVLAGCNPAVPTASASPGRLFAPTGALTAARDHSAAILLADGRVLIAGGSDRTDRPSALASAELYNPTTATFASTGSMGDARAIASATLLPSGRVLIVGGNNGTNTLASAELYEPKSGVFIATGAMKEAREFHTATLLQDGRVLIAGGRIRGTDLRSAELFDPLTGTFSPTGAMADGRAEHTATLLPDGRVLVAGGFSTPGGPLASAEIYDPSTGTFARTGAMADARAGHTATLLANGGVLIAGGLGAVVVLASAELYDPVSRTFTPTGSMASARVGHTATQIPGGLVLIVGGENDTSPGSKALGSGELYDAVSGSFNPTGAMAEGRSGHTSTLLSNRSVLVAGGSSGSSVLMSAELFH